MNCAGNLTKLDWSISGSPSQYDDDNDDDDDGDDDDGGDDDGTCYVAPQHHE